MLAGYYHKEGKEQEVILPSSWAPSRWSLRSPGRCTVDPWRACCRCEGGDGGHGSTEHIIVAVFTLIPSPRRRSIAMPSKNSGNRVETAFYESETELRTMALRIWEWLNGDDGSSRAASNTSAFCREA